MAAVLAPAHSLVHRLTSLLLTYTLPLESKIRAVITRHVLPRSSTSLPITIDPSLQSVVADLLTFVTILFLAHVAFSLVVWAIQKTRTLFMAGLLLAALFHTEGLSDLVKDFLEWVGERLRLVLSGGVSG